jgi:hypothetical protein
MRRLKSYVPIALVRASRPLRRLVARWRWVRRTRRRFRRALPATVHEKIQYRMAFDRRPILTLFADKYAVRDYVRERVGPEVLTEVYATVERFKDLDVESLPERCVIKPSHGSGAVIIVDDRAPIEAVLPTPKHISEWTFAAVRVRKSALLTPQFRQICESWLRNRYSPVSEWAYRNVPARLIVEELLAVEGDVPPDFKMWCVNGYVKFIQVDADRFGEHSQSLHLPDWTPLEAWIAAPAPVQRPPKPEHLDELLAVTMRLAEGIDFARIDLYLVDGRVRFGEMTFYPLAGGGSMSPTSVFTALAADWRPWEHVAPGPRVGS